MPHIIGPQQDPFQRAAHLVLDGDIEGAWLSVKDRITSNAAEDYEPDNDADEDGEYTDYNRPAHRLLSHEITLATEMIGDAIWEILTTEQGIDDEQAQSIAAEKSAPLDATWQPYVDDLAPDLVDGHKDGVAYSRDPNAYHGVSNKDFF